MAIASPAARAAALVVVITISCVLAAPPPTIGPAKLAYSPWIGFTPARTLAAMPSGTPAIAPGMPATASDRSVFHGGSRRSRCAFIAAMLVGRRGSRRSPGHRFPRIDGGDVPEWPKGAAC